ncbi:MAG: hypothetical protein KGM17_04265 [Sphingomonadales bacterium]|nr:hypothetical protein [Sphingomonadales bacterium]
MNRIRILLAALAGITFGLATPALAGEVQLASEVKVDRVVREDGRERHVLVPATRVFPGDRLVFSTRYRNGGARPAEHFVVTNPLPAAVRLADDGFGTFEASVDGGRNWGALAALVVPDGKGGSRPAQAADVTQVRWVIAAIPPGGDGVVEYHAVVR